MYITTVPNRNSPPAILLREGWRDGSKTHKRTLANLSHWPPQKIETFRRLLQDEPLVSPLDLFSTQKTLPHGHVQAVLMAMRKLGLDSLIASKRCRERDLVMAMIAARLLHPCSKLAITREWHTTTLAEELSVADATEDDLYQAMDWPGTATAHREETRRPAPERRLSGPVRRQQQLLRGPHVSAGAPRS